MATKETKANVKANESNVKANESATAKVDNESNATDESKAKATEPTAEQIAAAKVEKKHETEIADRYTLETPTEVEKSKFAGAYVLGVWRAPKDVKKNGDKTFYKIYYSGTIYDGYSATEFCDAVGIERKHRAGNTPKVTTLLDKLQALKTAIEAIGSNDEQFTKFAEIVAQKIESEKLESDRIAFVAKYAAAIALFAEITEATCAKIYGSDVLTLAKKLGYKFSDTKATDKATDNNESESESNESESK